MNYSKNIQISADFSTSDKITIHERKLEIGSLNLDRYNLKFDNHDNFWKNLLFYYCQLSEVLEKTYTEILLKLY